MQKKKVTLKDVSERLNISQNTVSMALRDRPGIKRETREKILEVARELGYKIPKEKEETKNICILSTADNLSDTYFYMKMQYALELQARANGYNLLLFNALNISMEHNEFLSFIRKNHIKGAIILGDLEIAKTQVILDCNIPIITSGFYYYNHYTDCVIEENTAGMFKAVDYLLKRGYRKIGFVGNPKTCMGYLERYMGFMGAAQYYELDVKPDWIITQFTPEDEIDDGYMADRIKAVRELPEAFICANDRIAMVLLKALHGIGLNVPGDIGIVGFDNSDLAKMSIPALTTVDVNIISQADMLVHKLIQKIEGEETLPERIIIPTELVIGASLK